MQKRKNSNVITDTRLWKSSYRTLYIITLAIVCAITVLTISSQLVMLSSSSRSTSTQVLLNSTQSRISTNNSSYLRSEILSAKSTSIDSMQNTTFTQKVSSTNTSTYLQSQALQTSVELPLKGVTEADIQSFWMYFNAKPLLPPSSRPSRSVHYIVLHPDKSLCFKDYLSIRSIFLNGDPSSITLHVLSAPTSSQNFYWNLIKPMIDTMVVENKFTHMFDREILCDESLVDIIQLSILSKEGGVVVGRFTLLHTSLSYLVAAPRGMLVGQSRDFTTNPQYLNSNLLIGQANHKFVQTWFGAYKHYDKYNWTELAGPNVGKNYLDFAKVSFKNTKVLPAGSGPKIAALVAPKSNYGALKKHFTLLDSDVYSYRIPMWRKNPKSWAIPASVSSIQKYSRAMSQSNRVVLQKLIPTPFISIILNEDNAELLLPSILSQRFQLYHVIVPASIKNKLRTDGDPRIVYNKTSNYVWEVTPSKSTKWEKTYLDSLLDYLEENTGLLTFVDEGLNRISFVFESTKKTKPIIQPGSMIKHTKNALKDCHADLRGNKAIMDTVNVMPVTKRSPTVLCYVLCNSAFHHRAWIIKNTWGSRCDKFIVASDVDDEALGAIAIKTKTPHSWLYLWDKHREFIRHVMNSGIASSYDYIFKADTDTFVIPENLKYHLSSLNNDEPQLVGSKFSFPEWVRGKRKFNISENFERFYIESGQEEKDKWMYASGAGFAMNHNFLQKFMSRIDDERCLPDMPTMSEDFGAASCVATSYKLSPANSRDEFGRERYHIWAPLAVTTIKEVNKRGTPMHWWHENHIPPYNPPPLTGEDSYSRESVLWHRIDDDLFYYMFNQFYTCRRKLK